MNLIEPNVNLILQPEGLDGIYKQIEFVGRSCWMSQNQITDDSAASFVKGLQRRGHTAPFEHGTVYLQVEWDSSHENNVYNHYKNNPYSRVKTEELEDKTIAYITTNYRVIYQNKWLDDLKYLCKPTDKHEIRLTFHFTCQRAISAEFNRHRHNSPMESSSRYCNFANQKFGKEISVVPAQWLLDEANTSVKQKYFHKPENVDAVKSLNHGLAQYCYEIANGYDLSGMTIIDYWWFANLACEHSYINMIRLGAKPEEAREILPMDLKTELYHTAYIDDWVYFCGLRAWDSKGNRPHPEAKILAEAVWNTLVALNFCDAKYREENEVIFN